MRKLPIPDGFPDDDPNTGFLDWKDGPETVLETVDDLLKAFGLEIVLFNTGADDHLFKIDKRQQEST